MPLAEAYRKQLALLIKIVPLVAAEPDFKPFSKTTGAPPDI